MSVPLGRTVNFHKMQGCGNDFAAIDNRELRVPTEDMPKWAKRICAKAFGVGADGVFFLENSSQPGVDYRWQFYNADGSRAEMCGNASRCAAKLAYLTGMAPKRHVLGTDAGPVQAEVLGEGERVRVKLGPWSPPELDIPLDIDGEKISANFTVAGVPHTVIVVPDAAAVDIKTLGPAVRYHSHFAPAGTNVNFLQLSKQGPHLLRTYERGVEDETYACGTGSCASLILANALGLAGESGEFKTSGGEILGVQLAEDGVVLEGAAEIVFVGQLNLEAVGLG
ncbi:MAG: diaminopimelate epimerase [Desulfovibrionales bacterium]|nr:diaminopimelate epimerase [Desulfovibrionales bacterium]